MTTTCSTDGAITMTFNTARAAVLQLSTMYPIGAVFAYDRSGFSTPCILDTLPVMAYEEWAVRAQFELRERAANLLDLFVKITEVSGTATDAKTTGKCVCPLRRVSSTRIFSAATSSRAVSAHAYDESLSFFRSHWAIRLVVNVDEKDITAQILEGSTSTLFNGKLNLDFNRIDAIDILVEGGGITNDSTYSVSRPHDEVYTSSVNSAGDVIILSLIHI